MEFLRSRKREVLFSGGYGSGKTVALCYKVVVHASIPGNTVLFLRKTYKSFKEMTLPILIEDEINGQKILPIGSYTYNKTDGIINLNGGGTIRCMGIEDVSKVEGANAGMVAVDEARFLSSKEWTTLLRRCRNPLDPVNQICGATNPSGRGHWLYKRFFTDEIKGFENRKVITVSSLDNKALDSKYIKDLKNMSEVEQDRYIYGKWVSLNGGIWTNFNRTKQVKDLGDYPYSEYIIGIDFGIRHNTGILLAGIYGDGHIHIIKEFRKAGMKTSVIADHMEEFRKYDATVLIDPSAAPLKIELEDREWKVENANNAVTYSISRIMNRFSETNGMYGLTISPNCPMLIEEIEGYSYKDDESEQPIKENDDLVDPLRYIVNYVEDQEATYLKPEFGGSFDDF